MDEKVTMGSEQGALSLIGKIKRDIISTQRKILIDSNRELILLLSHWQGYQRESKIWE